MLDQLTADLKQRMLKVVGITKGDLGTIRTGRATPALVDQIEIATYGGSQKLKVRELATVTTSDVHTLIIAPFDSSTKDDIVKGIQLTNIGLQPVIEGETIRVTIPLLSQERREEYIKLAHAKLEAGRIMIRQVRHDEMAKLKRAFEAEEMTKDDKFRLEKQIQETTDAMIDEINRLGQLKEQELTQV